MTVETLYALGEQVHYRQAISPNHQHGSFTGDDTDNHDFLFPGRGKSTLNIEVDNAPNQALTWALYGMHEADGEVGDPGTFTIDSGSIDTAGKGDEGFMGYSFPFYLLRLAYAVAPTDSPLKTVNVYINETVGL
jgi:hypothetical protein